MTQPNGSPPAEQPAQPQALALTTYQERQIALREQMSQDAAPRAIVPRTFAEAQAFATSLSQSALVPEKLRDRAPDVLMIVLAGAELEIPPVRALSLFHVIEGVPKLSADGIAGVCMANPLCEYLEPVEQSDERVTWAAKKRGRPEIRLSWTKADADRAGLFKPTYSGKPSNHTKYPRQMLNARCKADLCRLVWPEVVSGLVSAEEARDLIDFESPSAAVFTAPTPPPAPPTTVTAGTNTGSGPAKGKSATKPKPPIDVSSTPSSGSSAPASSSTSSGSSSNIAPTPTAAAPTPTSERPTPPATSEQSSTPSPSGSSAPTPPTSKDATESISETAPSESSVSVADEDGFGEEQPKAPAGSPEVTPSSSHPPAMKFEQYKIELANATAKTLDVVKDRWVPWSRQGMEGNAYATEMRTMFGKRKAELA